MKKIQALRGMNDLLPAQTPIYQYLEHTVTGVFKQYGYQEIRFPLLEQTALFKRSIGEVTDIVEKEMYTFSDRNDESITLRPEGTASCVRACEQHQLLFNRGNLIQKLWYHGPMFRYEKPQKGRLRQFHQFGVEIFGIGSADIEAEVLMLTARLWALLGIEKHVELQINCLGSSEAREAYKAELVVFLEANKEQLDADSQRRLGSNPLRILDSKDKNTQALLNDAPKLSDYLSDESTAHFAQLQALLDAANIRYVVNPRLVRGLDYYNDTVFEWVTDALGSQGTICAGGRYDSLVNQLGGQPTSAFGFGMGQERLALLVDELNLVPNDWLESLDVYILALGNVATQALLLAEQLRTIHPTLKVQTHCGGGSFKNQMKKADRSGASIALLLGENEAQNNEVTVKYLRDEKPQTTIKQTDLERIF